MQNVMIRFEESMLEQLDVLAKEEHVTRSYLIRFAAEKLLTEKLSSKANSQLAQFAGVLKSTSMNVDGLEYQRKIREEWERN